MQEVILYSQPDCPPCEFIKLLLKEHGIAYDEKNIKSDGAARKTLMNTYNMFSTPVLVIKGKPYTPSQLEEIRRILGIQGE
ncbi:glutaredoxin family protein [Peribacillus sp. SCS-26]|uniref:glutaredoxin family protein n=1 Tax=Paraperibacillus marinus TaxID=3115295 RepID=UPI00390604CA